MKAQSEHYRNIVREEEQETASPNLITDVDGIVIDPEWASEFRGFFWGEGQFNMQKWQQRRGYSISCKIQLRDDDRWVLDIFQNRLGGTYRNEPNPDKQHKSKPTQIWQVSELEDCMRIAKILQLGTDLPFRKKLQLRFWNQALILKKEKGARVRCSNEYCSTMKVLWDTIRKLKEYDPN